jgi:Recombination endonuclease VII
MGFRTKEDAKAYAAAYYAAHREEHAANTKARKEADPEKFLAQQRKAGAKYDAAHREEKSAKRKARYAANPGKEAARAKAYRLAHPEKRQEYHLRFNYGLTREGFEALMANQDGRCAICHLVFNVNDRKTRPHVDHDHACCLKRPFCGKCIRGLLCELCNHMVGEGRDDPMILESGARYLRSFARLREVS